MSSAVGLDVRAVRISTTQAAVDVVAEAGRTTVDSQGVPMEIDGDVVTVAARSQKVRVRIPKGLDVIVGTTSGRVSVQGRVRDLAVVTTSGKVTVDEASSVDVRTTNGKVVIGHSDGDCRVVTRNGRIEIGRCAAADVTTTSGKIVLRDVHGDARANCTSGRIEISMAAAHDVVAETVSGRVSISLPADARPKVDSSSGGSVPVGGDHDCTVTARSASGRVTVSHR